MAFSAGLLQEHLRVLAGESPPGRYVVAFSGGLDSTVLLHALSTTTMPLLAVHVNHGLHADSGSWEEHCRNVAKGLGVQFRALAVEVVDRDGGGMEAAARRARYDALAALLSPGDWLLSAHHRDDQAETALLHLMRGSGLAGLAGIADIRPFAGAHLVRPLLHEARPTLQDYASQNRLHWLHDPSNADTDLDRNYLRHEILPRLQARWPAAASQIARSAGLAGEGAALLEELADDDLAQLGAADRIDIAAFSRLSDARRRNVLRRALQRLRLPAAPGTCLRQVIDELVPARDDAVPLVAWSGAEVRRYRGAMYILPPLRAEIPTPGSLTLEEPLLDLAELGTLQLVAAAQSGIDPRRLENGVEIRFRKGGEAIRPTGHAVTHKLKKLLQQAGVVPWMRNRIPLLYADGELLAVGDLWLSDDYASTPGVAVSWQSRPAIF